MRHLLPYFPILNILLIPIMGYVIKLEKERAKVWLLIKQICRRLDIEHGE